MVVGCTAPRIVLLESDDSGSEVATDAASDSHESCRTFRLDGGVCSGHDDDGDCVPDTCDSCPSVVDAPLTGSVLDKGIETIPEGAACAHAFAPFDTVRTRLFFEPFDDPSHTFAVHTHTAIAGLHRGTSEITIGGAGVDGTGSPFLLFPTELPEDRPAVLITVMRIETGAGVLMRETDETRDTYDAYGCYVSATFQRFGPYRGAPPCGVDDCAAFMEVKTPWPVKLLGATRVGLRMSVANVAGGALVECELFDPAQPETLLRARTGSDYVVRTTFPEPVLHTGRAGLFTQAGATVFESVDVQIAP
jgi:hypothetical protein